MMWSIQLLHPTRRLPHMQRIMDIQQSCLRSLSLNYILTTRLNQPKGMMRILSTELLPQGKKGTQKDFQRQRDAGDRDSTGSKPLQMNRKGLTYSLGLVNERNYMIFILSFSF